MNRSGRAKQYGVSLPMTLPRTIRVHPDAGRATRQMPIAQLAALVVSLLEPDGAVSGELAGDESDGFETEPTTFMPRARVSTIDQLIAELPKR